MVSVLAFSKNTFRYKKLHDIFTVLSLIIKTEVIKDCAKLEDAHPANPDLTILLSIPSFFFFFFFFFFFDLGFTALSRIFHLYRADRSSKVGENRRTRRKTT